MANIYKAINEVMKEIGAVGKTQKNEQQKFMYRGIDAIMNAINPALINHNVFIVPEVLEQTREERVSKTGNTLLYSICKIRFTFYAEDGSHVEAVTVGEGMDSGDKATNKAMAIAFKYACFQVFCIPTEEMVDPDEECHTAKAANNSQNANSKEAKENSKEAKENSKAKEEEENQRMMKEAAKVKISAVKVKALNKRCEDDKVPVELLCSLYTITKLEEMNEAQFRNASDHWEQIKAKANK